MASTRPQDFGAASAQALASTLTKRRPERARLLDCLAGLDRGVGRLVLVTGASGTGKSKLLAELETTARDNGVYRVLLLDGARGRHPLRPLQRLIAQLAALAPEAEQERFARWQQAPLGQGDLASEPVARRHHYEEIARTIATTATQQPVVLIFADLEELDPTIQELFDYLAERLFGDGAPPVLLVGSGRVGRALPSSVAAETLALQPLDHDAIRDLLTSPEVVSFFAETTGGQLSTLVAMLHHLPNNLSSLFATRLDRLSEGARFVLELLALSAGELEMEDMLFAFGRTARSPEALRGALSELQTARLVESRAHDGMLVFALCERAERETVVASLPDESARHTHLLLADIARRHREHEGNRVEHAVAEAEHLIAAAAGDRAVEAALAAADGLRQMAAPHRAIALYRRAAELTPDESLRSEIDRRLHSLELDTGDYQAALESAERLRRRQPGAAAWLLVARTHLLRDEHAQALDALLHGLQARPDATERGELGALLAEAHYLAGDRTAATLVATEALATDPSVAQAIELRNTLGKIHLASGDLDPAMAAFDANVSAAQTASLPREECRARFNAGIVELQRGDRTAAEAAYRAALAIADRTGDTRNRAFVLQNLAVLRHWSSDFTDAIALFREAISAFRQLGQRGRLAWLAHDLSSVYLDLGDLVQAESLVQLGERYAAAAPSIALDIDRMMLRGRLAILAQDLPRAASVLDEAARRADESGDRSRARRARLLLAEAAIDAGQVDAPATQRTFAQATSGNPAPREQAAVAYLEGRWKLASSDIAGAIEALTQATRLAEGLPDLDLAWKALFALAEAQHQDRPAWAPKRDRRKPSPHVRRLLERADALWHRVAQPLSDELRASYANLPSRRRLIELLYGTEPTAAPSASRTGTPPAPLAAPVLPSPALVTSAPTRPFRLVGEHPKLLSALALIDKVAPFDSPVLIRGESGTGKELVADEIWARSPRDQKPIVKVNCGALVESLLLSELFGHEKGAFTGAHMRKKGCFETAHGGTLFLDEIGDISPKTQVALLRVLQEREFLRVGGNEPVKVDVRLIFATHRNLEEMVGKGLFREDLYYRLRGIQIELPPLRERPSDVVLLARALLDKIARERGEAARTLDPEAEALCRAHRWPGNVRELDNTLRSVSLFAESTVITAHDLLRYSDLGRGRTAPTAQTEHGPSAPSFTRLQEERISLRELKTQIEIECIGKALRETRGNITRAAEKLGMKRPRLSQLIKQYGITLGEGVESQKESV